MDQKKVRDYWMLKYWYRPLIFVASYFSWRVVRSLYMFQGDLKKCFTGNSEEGPD